MRKFRGERFHEAKAERMSFAVAMGDDSNDDDYVPGRGGGCDR